MKCFNIKRLLAVCAFILLVGCKSEDTSSKEATPQISPAQKERAELLNKRGLTGTYIDGLVWEHQPESYLPTFIPEDRILKTQLDGPLVLRWKKEQKPAKHFSVEWKGGIYIPKDGTYVFATKSDDGSVLYINERRVVDNWGKHHAVQVEGSISLKEGWHPIVVRYDDRGWGARIWLLWAPPGSRLKTLPLYNLRPVI